MKITGSNKQKIYHEYHKPYLCKLNGKFPPMVNGGWNDYHFSEAISFEFENMPLIPKTYGGREHENNGYKWYSCSIEVEDISGKKITGYYYITYDKKEQKFISESADFS